jgi:serine/threonine protein phosphatase PrpC
MDMLQAGRMVLGKKLRLATAGKTDVGRKRDRNQDNVTHLVPDDEQVLAAKGALFVVCDGMGGHAAGEVASELGVNTIRNVYFESDDPNIISRFAEAVKRANETIYQYATEHPASQGMGTTCVALAVHDGRAYVVNIGDSRAYVVRDGAMRQVTQDHSWVAEQVRAGLLTEEQARIHSHRNVITRSLGTQPTVNADLFVETLHDGDRVLLCSDGLHGYVDDRELLREMVEHQDPALGVQHLIDLANANGGPDNITALVVHLLEVPAPAKPLPYPLTEDDEKLGTTQPLPAMPAPSLPKDKPHVRQPGKPQEQRPDKSREQRAPAAVSAPRPRGRVAVAALRMLAVAALIAIAAGIWDFGFGPYATARAATQQLQHDTAQAKQVAQQAQQQDPAAALAALAQAQQRLDADLDNSQVDPQAASDAQTVLATQLTPAVQSAVQRYNTAALIHPVSANDQLIYPVTCAGASSPTQTPLAGMATALAAVAPPPVRPGAPAPTTQTLYAVVAGALYQISVPLDTTSQPAGGIPICTTLALPNVATIVALTSEGPNLYALTQQGGGAYESVLLAPSGANPNGTPKVTIAQRFTIATPHGETPDALAVQGGNIYVAYKAGSTGEPGIWQFSGKSPKSPTQTFSLTEPATAIALANNTLYGLLADGSLGEVDTTHTWQTADVQVQDPLSPQDPASYAAATPVPTVPPASSTPSAVSGATLFPGATLAADPSLPTHLFVADGARNRIVRLVASAVGAGPTLAEQYVYGQPLANPSQLAFASNGTNLAVFVWTGQNLVAFAVAEPTS